MCGQKGKEIRLKKKKEKGLFEYSSLVRLWDTSAKPHFKINWRNISFEFEWDATEKPVCPTDVDSLTGVALMWHFVAFENAVK